MSLFPTDKNPPPPPPPPSFYLVSFWLPMLLLFARYFIGLLIEDKTTYWQFINHWNTIVIVASIYGCCILAINGVKWSLIALLISLSLTTSKVSISYLMPHNLYAAFNIVDTLIISVLMIGISRNCYSKLLKVIIICFSGLMFGESIGRYFFNDTKFELKKDIFPILFGIVFPIIQYFIKKRKNKSDGKWETQ